MREGGQNSLVGESYGNTSIESVRDSLSWSMPNADQCRSKLHYWSQCRSIKINADHADQFLINIDHIDRNWEVFRVNFRIFIGIDLYWSTLDIDQGSPGVYYTDISKPSNVAKIHNEQQKWLHPNTASALALLVDITQ